MEALGYATCIIVLVLASLIFAFKDLLASGVTGRRLIQLVLLGPILGIASIWLGAGVCYLAGIPIEWGLLGFFFPPALVVGIIVKSQYSHE